MKIAAAAILMIVSFNAFAGGANIYTCAIDGINLNGQAVTKAFVDVSLVAELNLEIQNDGKTFPCEGSGRALNCTLDNNQTVGVILNSDYTCVISH